LYKLKKDETISNKDIFNDQQKLALEHIHKHYQEILKKLNVVPKSKSIFPSVKTIQEKLKIFIEETEKQKAIINKSKEAVETANEKPNEPVNSKKSEEKKIEEINDEEYPNLGSEKNENKALEETKQNEAQKKNDNEDTINEKEENKEQIPNEVECETNRSSTSNKSGAINSANKEENLEKKEEEVETKTSNGGLEVELNEEIKETEDDALAEASEDQFSGNVNLTNLLGRIDIKENLNGIL